VVVVGVVVVAVVVAVCRSSPLARRAKRLVILAYDRSPKNGARINLVRVPITLRP